MLGMKTGEGELVRIGVNWGYTSSQLGESIDASILIAIVAFLTLVTLHRLSDYLQHISDFRYRRYSDSMVC